MGDLSFKEIVSDGFGEAGGALLIGIGQDQDELFPTIAGREVARPTGCMLDDVGDVAQSIVTLLSS